MSEIRASSKASTESQSATELLEHVDDDLGVLRQIPRRTLTLFSVPNFDDPAHVRYFSSETAVGRRYRGLFDRWSITWTSTSSKSKNGVWLASGLRI